MSHPGTLPTSAEIAAQLQAKGYVEVAVLDQTNIGPFIQQGFKHINPITVPYLLFFLAFFGTMGGLVGLSIGSQDAAYGKLFGDFGLGMAASFLLVYPHEAIHADVYRRLGATHVYIKAIWRKLYFLCTADRFVTDYNGFMWLAVMPGLVITALLGAIALVCGNMGATNAVVFLAGMAGMHLGLCGGDAALMSYMYGLRKRQPVTWDDEPTGLSYFYALAEASA